jgi:hypothetical protein
MSLGAAIEAVYDSFSDVEKPSVVNGCPCCMTADEYEALTAKPLRELSPKELNRYAFDVMLTMGSEDDYRYFLPRILELTIENDPEWLTDVEITAKRLHAAGFERWDEKKQSSISELWLAVIRNIATSASDPELLGFRANDIEDWLAAATLIPIPVSPFTQFLDAFPEIVQTLYNYNFETLSQGRLKNAFLEEPSDGQAEIANWLRRSVENTINN